MTLFQLHQIVDKPGTSCEFWQLEELLCRPIYNHIDISWKGLLSVCRGTSRYSKLVFDERWVRQVEAAYWGLQSPISLPSHAAVSVARYAVDRCVDRMHSMLPKRTPITVEFSGGDTRLVASLDFSAFKLNQRTLQILRKPPAELQLVSRQIFGDLITTINAVNQAIKMCNPGQSVIDSLLESFCGSEAQLLAMQPDFHDGIDERSRCRRTLEELTREYCNRGPRMLDHHRPAATPATSTPRRRRLLG